MVSLAQEHLSSADCAPHLLPNLEEPQRLLHELQVHQVELEQQNEELRQVRAELESALEKYTDLYEFAPVGYLTLDRRGIVQSSNLTGAGLLGTGRSALTGRLFQDFLVPSERPAFATFLENACSSQSKGIFDGSLSTKSAPPVFLHLEALGAASGQECRLALFDVTESRLMERELLASEAHYRLLTEGVSDVVWKLDTDFRVTYISPADERLRGYRASEVVGRPVFEMLAGSGVEAVREKIRVRQEAEKSGIRTGTLSFEIQQLCRSGALVWTEMLSTPVRDPQGEITGFHGVTRDITERKKALKLEQRFFQSQKLESLGVLAGGIAHDFNNILMAVFGNADLALMDLDPQASAVKNLHRIQEAAVRAAELTKQMLAYSGKGRFVLERLYLNQLLKQMLPLLQGSVSRNAKLRLEVPESLPAVLVDASQMHQVVMNLILNASEALGEAGGVITLRVGSLQCDSRGLLETWPDDNVAEGRYVLLEVADTGCGMDREALDKLFDPFFSTKFAGRGLGLAAVQGIVKGHEGYLKVVSAPGLGASFTILLPESAAAEAPPTQAGRPPRDSRAADWKGSGTVLLVDDEEAVRKVGCAMLRALGFTPVIARDGLEALAVFQDTPGIVLVLLDLTMPRLDGAGCFRELRRLDPGVKVIMSSGFSEQEVTREFAGLGLAGFIHKPYKVAGLAGIIRKVIEA
jgi:two-component system, cell cycle sensor histidine kinase and response regulator CckA